MTLIQIGQPPVYETWRIALTIGGSIVTFMSLVVTAYVLFRSKTAKYWKDERDAAVAKAERLAAENKVLNEKVTVLEAQRDLTSVQEGQAAIVRAIEALAGSESERFTTMRAILDAYQQTATEMVTLLKQMREGN